MKHVFCHLSELKPFPVQNRTILKLCLFINLYVAVSVTNIYSLELCFWIINFGMTKSSLLIFRNHFRNGCNPSRKNLGLCRKFWNNGKILFWMVLKCKNMYMTIVNMICIIKLLIIKFKTLTIVIIVISKFAIFWKNRIW